ncbi:MAG: HAMP domain-containing histidine kinase [Roseburia sp.]|nr:HAMP domain-containing histidine kinase [Roseburia sp.]MCM1098048.1 HAMP domain-containing histidine kinase [Ruminococcus flavefaciens]
MKFADKLFLATTALLTVIFTVFGVWMLSSNFSSLLGREIERGNSESRLFRFLFETGYRSMEEYGADYAVRRTMDSIADSVERDGSHCFVLYKNVWMYGMEYMEERGLLEAADGLTQAVGGQNSYGYVIRKTAEGFFLLTVSRAEGSDNYLGLCRELTDIYGIRQDLLAQYRIALLFLLLLGGAGIYLLSRYITRPIIRLGRTAKRIADGDFELRSRNRSPDEIGRLARDFDRMADRLVEQMEAKALEAKQKEDFTAAFAHELKTPLTSIIGYADMMNTMKMSEAERSEAIYYIYSQGKRLESLSHKLLELVSMDKSPLTVRPVPAKKLEENLRSTMRPIWEIREIRGKVEMDKGVICGDEELLLSLFYNLLDNAVKATDKGEKSFVFLKGSVRPDGNYEVKVVDNGRGIPEEEISRITEAFYMVDKSRSRREGGAGIGMALCHKIIKLHGGSLMIDSRLGEGTVMKVIFPAMKKQGATESGRRKKGGKRQDEAREKGREEPE